MLLTVFYMTTQAAAENILRDGFRDAVGRYLTDREWSGVWVSDRPLDMNERNEGGEALLQIDIAETCLPNSSGSKRANHFGNGWCRWLSSMTLAQSSSQTDSIDTRQPPCLEIGHRLFACC